MILIAQQSDYKQPVKLMHVLVNINKATLWPLVEIKGQSTELGGGRVIVEKYNFKG